MPLPASLDAIAVESRKMLDRIDQEKAACFVQQITNGHDDDDLFAPDQTYAQRLTFLEESEQKLRGSLPPVVVEQLDSQQSS